MSTANDLLQANETSDIKPAAPKRRGRKRKAEIYVRELEDMVETSPIETVSRRGRPRKKVNYYELANPENVEDFSADFQSEVNYFSIENEEIRSSKRKKASEKNVSAAEISEPSIEVSKVVNRTEQHSETVGKDQNHHHETTQGNGVYKNTDTINEESNVSSCSLKESEINENINLEMSSIELEATTSTPKTRDKRYNYTGETVKMMNTLFTLFANNSEAKTVDKNNCNDTNDTNNTSNGDDSILQNPQNTAKRPYRKYKKGKVKEEDIDDGSGNITCAVCNTTLDKNLWSHHKQRYHNNLAWRVGDPPLDLSDQSFVMHTLNSLYKKKKPLYCDKCGEVKKSVVGFLSHQSTCRKSEEQLESVKIACEICGRKMLPVSMSTHMKFLHSNPVQKDEVVEKTTNENKLLPSKRSAAKKALKIIENVTKNDSNEDQYFTSNLNFGSLDFAKQIMQKELDEKQCIECKFKCDCVSANMEEALKHLEQCPERPSEGFACKQCLLVSAKLEEIIYHVELDHDVSIEVDEDATYNEKGNVRMPSFLYSNTKKSERVLFPGAFEWTNKFQEENFSDLLFENLSFKESNWPLLPLDAAQQYLPNMNESCDVARIHVTSFINPLNKEYSFKKYKLFGYEMHEDNKITLFCGGPVSSMAWLPTPRTKLKENQILAVSVLNSPDEKYLTSDNYEVASAIQFWNFGCLDNKAASLKEPKLIFNVAHNHGPVWHMEWCPSGCYNFNEEKMSRMGLLAVAGSDSAVYIYSIPFFREEETGLFYKPKPVMKLLLQRPGSSLLGDLKYYATKVSWSKASGHSYIAVGYTNGFVALFNLKSNSFILKYKDFAGVTCLLPNKCFQAHSHSISALALYHLNGGCRWLMTGSLDRGVNLWDLNNHNYPICSTKKNIITDGFWLTNWLCYMTAADEGSTSMHVTTMLKQTRDYICDSNVTLTFSPSTISTISGSDWLNGMLHGNTVGEIVALFPHQLLQITEHRKVFKSKRMLFGYTYLIEKRASPEQRVEDEKIKKKTLQHLLTKKLSVGVKLSKIKSDYDDSKLFCNESVFYHEAQEKYGLLFCDNKMESYDDLLKSTAHQLSAFSKSYGVTHPNQYPMTAINKVVFNPNRQASLYYATGYQAGFVRISWMEFLKSDQQIK